jgi:hypothetical protein
MVVSGKPAVAVGCNAFSPSNRIASAMIHETLDNVIRLRVM